MNNDETFVASTSYSQRRLWFLEQIEGGTPAWNIQIVLRLRGALDVDLLRDAVNESVRRHEALRTTFATEDGEPVQVIHSWKRVEIPLKCCDGEPNPERAAVEQMEKHWLELFDIERGPLFRACLFRISDEEHQLALVLHHLVADGWSIQVLYREIMENYRRCLSGERPPFADLDIQYADFAVWEQENRSVESLADSMEIWRQRLKDAGPPPELPADRQSTGTRTQPGLLFATLPGDLVADTRRLAAKNGATLFVALLAAFNTMLYRYTGESDVMVGVPVANRSEQELADLVGCFVNTLALRTDLGGDPTFQELIVRARDVTLEALQHQEVPFEQIVEELRPGRENARQPFFQAVLHLSEAVLHEIHLDGLTVDVARVDTQAPGVDIAVTLVETRAGLGAAWEYEAARFEVATIERMQMHFQMLLESATAQPDQRLSELQMLSEAERVQLLAPGVAAEPGAGFLHEVFAGWVRERPDAVAVVCGDVAVSFAEVDARADRLAGVLRAQGVGPDVRVGVCLPRSVDFVVAVLGVLKAGGAFVPLDPQYPLARLEYMLRDSAALLVVGEGAPAEALGASVGVRVLAPGQQGATEAASGPALVADNLAYVIYTSGSTGKPKGVQVTHRGLSNVLTVQRALFGLGVDDAVIQFCSQSFDAAVFELALGIGAGARLVLGSPEELLPGQALADLMRRHGVTAWTAPPSAISALGAADVPALRLVLSCGEPLNPAVVRPWSGQAEVFNLYGPTETTIWGTAQRLGQLDGDLVVSIGEAIPGCSALVLDAHMQPVPANVVGELYLGGIGVTRGYRGRPALTAERFVPDLYSQEPGGRLYRTGDLARKRVDGRIEFVGRSDDQIKIRGFRVELGETESALVDHPGVRDCAVVIRQDAQGAVGLVACFVPARGGSLASSDELRDYLRERLPEQFVPSGFLSLDSLPVTANGKIDRAALTALVSEREAGPLQSDRRPYEAPRTPLEEVIAGIWAELLGVEKISIHDDFFERGGHSLVAAQVISRIRSETGVAVSVRMLFENRVLSELAEAVVAQALAKGEQNAGEGAVR